ncbi:BNR-4 repeat-containing protein [Nonomuraea candida]|uniref:BNR-4 repeat-containing protein n=1 Tax=Nonomuraea candida TaxID=359159 RepID=UPI0006944894|nr:BNR-4 repeat-containing protein [Nonomuraea candida]
MPRPLSRTLTALVAAVATLLTTATTAAHAAALNVVPVPATTHPTSSGAGWWTPIAHLNGATYVTYLDAGLRVVVARQGADGAWTSAVVDTGIAADAGHTQPSIALDGDGYIHVFYGMHDNPMRYRRSDRPESVTGGWTDRSAEIAAVAPENVFTYPIPATTPNGDVYLLIRSRGRHGELYRWQDAADTWSLVRRFGSESGYTFYPDAMVADDAGDLHIAFEWAKVQPRPERHLGSYVRYSPADDAFYQAGGARQELPITRATSDVHQPMRAAETWDEWGVQGAKLTVDGQRRPLIAFDYSLDGTTSGMRHRLSRRDGDRWAVTTMSAGYSHPDKPWITHSGGVTRYYFPDAAQNVRLRASRDGGATWTDEQQLTSGRRYKSLAGHTSGGTDRLYLNALSAGELYVGLSTGGETLLADDFEDGAAQGWAPAGGSWSVVTDGTARYRQASLAGNNLATAGQSTWSDYSVRVSVKRLSHGAAPAVGISARYTGAGDRYGFNHSDGVLHIMKRVGGVPTVLASKPYPLETGRSYTFTATLTGRALAFAVDGVQELTAVDGSHTAGGIALATYNATASFDDVRVTAGW